MSGGAFVFASFKGLGNWRVPKEVVQAIRVLGHGGVGFTA